jgi:hypothetical protein
VTVGSRYVPYEHDSGDEPRRRLRSGVLITVVVVAFIIGAILFLTSRA